MEATEKDIEKSRKAASDFIGHDVNIMDIEEVLAEERPLSERMTDIISNLAFIVLVARQVELAGADYPPDSSKDLARGLVQLAYLADEEAADAEFTRLNHSLGKRRSHGS